MTLTPISDCELNYNMDISTINKPFRPHAVDMNGIDVEEDIIIGGENKATYGANDNIGKNTYHTTNPINKTEKILSNIKVGSGETIVDGTGIYPMIGTNGNHGFDIKSLLGKFYHFKEDIYYECNGFVIFNNTVIHIEGVMVRDRDCLLYINPLNKILDTTIGYVVQRFINKGVPALRFISNIDSYPSSLKSSVYFSGDIDLGVNDSMNLRSHYKHFNTDISYSLSYINLTFDIDKSILRNDISVGSGFKYSEESDGSLFSPLFKNFELEDRHVPVQL